MYSVEKGEGQVNKCKHKLPVSVRKSKKINFWLPAHCPVEDRIKEV